MSVVARSARRRAPSRSSSPWTWRSLRRP